MRRGIPFFRYGIYADFFPGVCSDGRTQEEGTYTLGAVATETISSEEEDAEDESSDSEEETKESRLTVVSSDSLIDSQLTDNLATLENLDLFMNAVTSNFDDTQNVAIEAKSLEITYNTMKHTGVTGMVAIVGIPALVLLFGFMKWWKRRKAQKEAPYEIKKGFFILLAVFLVLVVCYLALKVWTEKAQEEEQAKTEAEQIYLTDTDVSEITSFGYSNGETELSFVKEEDTWYSETDREMKSKPVVSGKYAEPNCLYIRRQEAGRSGRPC